MWKEGQRLGAAQSSYNRSVIDGILSIRTYDAKRPGSPRADDLVFIVSSGRNPPPAKIKHHPAHDPSPKQSRPIIGRLSRAALPTPSSLLRRLSCEPQKLASPLSLPSFAIPAAIECPAAKLS